LVLITLFAEKAPWIWMTLPALPLICWMLDDEGLFHKRDLASVIDSTAKDQSLTRLKIHH
jgi:hypothetical protein